MHCEALDKNTLEAGTQMPQVLDDENAATHATKNMAITLEKNIPIPNKVIGHGKWQQLAEAAEVGDSFTIPIEKRSIVHGCLRKRAMITTRKIDEYTVRVWIVEKFKVEDEPQ